MDEVIPDDKAAVDAAAVARVAAGDAVALQELYERYGKVIYSFAYRLTHDTTLSEECVQDVFVTLWRRSADFDPTRAKLTTWLFVVARNRAIELGRQKTRRPELRDDLEPVGTCARSRRSDRRPPTSRSGLPRRWPSFPRSSSRCSGSPTSTASRTRRSPK